MGGSLVLASSGDDPKPRPERIAFDSNLAGNSNIYSMLPDGTDVVRVTDDPGQDLDPSWAPPRADRPQRIAFASDRDGDFDLYSVEADGSHLRRLTRNDTSDTGPAWSPGGRFIAFASRRHENTDVYIMRADGSHERRLTDSPVVDRAPAWSPDGTRLAFESGSGGTPHIWAMTRVGDDLRQVTDGRRADSHPAWFQFGVTADPATPADDLIAFDRLRPKGNYEVESVFVTGQAIVNLSASIAADTTPAWSSGGRRIAFASTRDDGQGDIYVMDASGTEQRRLTREPSSEGNPDWSGAIVADRRVRAPIRGRRRAGGGCTILGNNGPNTLYGGPLNNVLCGYGGDDRLFGRSGNDKLVGGDGNDTMYGGGGDDTFWAKDGRHDVIYGGPGSDSAIYDAGIDDLNSAHGYP